MKGNIGRMNIPFSEVYNEEDDVYYVTFKTGEPSYCVEVDDRLILEVGMFTGLPTGFRILNFNKNRFASISFAPLIKKIKEVMKHEVTPPNSHDRQAQVRQALEEVLSR